MKKILKKFIYIICYIIIISIFILLEYILKITNVNFAIITNPIIFIFIDIITFKGIYYWLGREDYYFQKRTNLFLKIISSLFIIFIFVLSKDIYLAIFNVIMNLIIMTLLNPNPLDPKTQKEVDAYFEKSLKSIKKGK